MKDFQTTILVDLSRTKEELLASFDRSRRKNIKKAEASGLIFRKASLEAWEFPAFYNIYRQVWSNGGIETDPEKELEERLQKKGSELFRCFKDGKIIGGAMICKNYPDRMKFSIVACDPAYNEFRTNDFMYWNLMCYIKFQGIKFADLGGFQENPDGKLQGVNRFKAMWNGKIQRDEIDISPVKAIGRKAYRESLLLRDVINMIKGRTAIKFKPKNN